MRHGGPIDEAQRARKDERRVRKGDARTARKDDARAARKEEARTAGAPPLTPPGAAAETEAPTSFDPLLADLPRARRRWQRTDPILADLARAHPPAPWPDANDDPFVSLARAIVHQQVSLAAGRTIYARFEAAVGGRVAPLAVLAAGEATVRGAGLSGQKTSYVLDLAARVADGELDFAGLAALDDDAATAQLVQVKGIGAWSAKMFLLFHGARPDICPWEDLGVRLAVERFYGVDAKETAAWIRDVARPLWSPYNSLAARVLWNARRADD